MYCFFLLPWLGILKQIRLHASNFIGWGYNEVSIVKDIFIKCITQYFIPRSIWYKISQFDSFLHSYIPFRSRNHVIFVMKPLYTFIDTLRLRQNGRHFPDDIFKWIFFNVNVWISIKISLKFVPKGPINNIPALVQIMAWCRPGDKPLSEAMMVSLLTHIYASLGLNELSWILRFTLKLFSNVHNNYNNGTDIRFKIINGNQCLPYCR